MEQGSKRTRHTHPCLSILRSVAISHPPPSTLRDMVINNTFLNLLWKEPLQ